jgi:hypothetical protein
MDGDPEPDLDAEVRDLVRPLVARGNRTFGDILDEAVEHLTETHADEARVKAACEREIGQAFADHFAAQATWPEITDCDRLDSAFQALNEGGIVAVHDFTCCQSCGLAEIGEEIGAAIRRGIDVSGFVFYHQQDTDNAAQGHGLHLTYGHVDGGEINGIAIGRIVVSALNAAGLETEWNGTLGKRIGVHLAWQRRIPRSAVLRVVGE